MCRTGAGERAVGDKTQRTSDHYGHVYNIQITKQQSTQQLALAYRTFPWILYSHRTVARIDTISLL